MKGFVAYLAILLISWEVSFATDTVGQRCPPACRRFIRRVSKRVRALEDSAPNAAGQPIVVGFSAKASVNQVGLGHHHTINFKTVITNIGWGYNGLTSVFTCPVKGVYHFGVTILSTPYERIETELMAAGISRMSIYSGAGPKSDFHGSGSNSVLLELNKGDVVFVRRHLGNMVRQLFSTFTGFLVG